MNNGSGTNNQRVGGAGCFATVLTILSTLANLLLLIVEFNERVAVILNSPYLKVYIRIAAVIMILSVTYFLYISNKKWISVLYILPVLGLIITVNPIEDWLKKFKEGDQIIGVIVPNFQSPISEDGVNFTQRLYKELLNRIEDPLTINVGDTVLSVNIRTQRVKEVWDVKQMKIRSKRRRASLGVVGDYKYPLDKGRRSEKIENFKVSLIDTLIANIFEESKPFGQIYEFVVKIEDITVTQGDSLPPEELATSAVKYIIDMAGNARLLQRATQVTGWSQDQTLSTFHERITDLGRLIKNPPLACFHHGNSLLRAAKKPKLPLCDQRKFFEEAARAYHESIDSLSSVTQQNLLKQFRPWMIYLNLSWTYMQLDSLTGDSAFKDSAEAVYDSVVVRYSNRETLEEQHSFLAELCETEFVVQKAPSRIKRAEQLYDKYKNCADKLDTEIRTSSPQLSNKDREILDKIEDNKKNFEAHLKKLRRLLQGV